MEMDIDEEGDALDGSSAEGCLVVDISQRLIVADPPGKYSYLILFAGFIYLVTSFYGWNIKRCVLNAHPLEIMWF